MAAQDEADIRDAFATVLVKQFGLSLRDLQLALELAAQAELELDVVLLEMKALTQEQLVEAAETVDFVLAAEQHAVPRKHWEGSRAFARHSSELAVRFKDWTNLKVAYAHNISRGGFGITMPLDGEVPAIGSTITLALSLPDGQTIEFKGRVCYCRDGTEHCHVGIQLHHESAEEVLQIDRLLRRHSS